MLELQGNVAQTYTHFPQVLGVLLTDLATLPGVIRLTKRRAHVIRGEGERNEYAWAIYRVAGLEPYRARLAELKGVQQRVFREIGAEARLYRTDRTPGRRGCHSGLA